MIPFPTGKIRLCLGRHRWTHIDVGQPLGKLVWTFVGYVTGGNIYVCVYIYLPIYLNKNNAET